MVAKKYVRHQLRLIKRSLLSAPIDTPQSRPPIRWAKYTKTSRSIYIEFKLVVHDFFTSKRVGNMLKGNLIWAVRQRGKKGEDKFRAEFTYVYICAMLAVCKKKRRALSEKRKRKEKKRNIETEPASIQNAISLSSKINVFTFWWVDAGLIGGACLAGTKRTLSYVWAVWAKWVVWGWSCCWTQTALYMALYSMRCACFHCSMISNTVKHTQTTL